MSIIDALADPRGTTLGILFLLMAAAAAFSALASGRLWPLPLGMTPFEASVLRGLTWFAVAGALVAAVIAFHW